MFPIDAYSGDLLFYLHGDHYEDRARWVIAFKFNCAQPLMVCEGQRPLIDMETIPVSLKSEAAKCMALWLRRPTTVDIIVTGWTF